MKIIILVSLSIFLCTCSCMAGSPDYFGHVSPRSDGGGHAIIYGTDGSQANIILTPDGTAIINTFDPPPQYDFERESRRTQEAIDALSPPKMRFHGFAPGEVIHLDD